MLKNLKQRIIIRIFLVISVLPKIFIAKKMHRFSRQKISVISNNCLAGLLYKNSNLKYQTPTVGLYFVGDAYKEFVEILISGSLRKSHYAKLKPECLLFDSNFNSLVYYFNEKPKIVFLHYTDAVNAVDSWVDRLNRIEGRQYVFLFSIRDGVSIDDYVSIKELSNKKILIGGNCEDSPPADLLLADPWHCIRLARAL